MNKTQTFNILDWCLWILNPFLIVLLIFEQKINAGILFLWIGKMHPLVLHFPIVFGILITIYFLFFGKSRINIETEKLLMAINALFAVLVAILGFFLAKNGEYQGKIFDLHKWGGVAIALFSWVLIFVLNSKPVFKKIIAVLFIFILLIATHKGAQLTHGINALSFPFSELFGEENKTVTDTNITVYEIAIQPILNQKCISCHGPDKVKGGLRLDSPEQILAGGENGDILSGNSILLSLIHLPIEDENHMPPDGKVQLIKEEIKLLNEWTNQGADFNLKMSEIDKDGQLDLALNNYISSVQKKNDIKTDLPDLAEYNTDYCTVNYLFYGSDEIEVNFFQGSFYNRETLNKLVKAKENIVHLNMQNMPLTNEDLDIILQFTKLKKVNLNSTQLEISDLESLKNLEQLKSVSICGIEFKETELENFLTEAKFTAINVWTDNINRKQLDNIIQKYPEIKFTIGDNLEDKVLKINSPVIDQDSSIIRSRLEVKLKHLLKGVDIFYTTDGNKPDSLSRRYSEPLWLTKNTKIKARAYKKGWIASDVVQRNYYKSGIEPDSIYLLAEPHPRYPGDGAKTLTNLVLGEKNIQNGEWLAYKDYDMEFMVCFSSPKELESVQLNALTQVQQHIFPIKTIIVEGSNDGKHFAKITEKDFPDAHEEAPRQADLYGMDFPEGTQHKYYRFILKNLKKMPDWHEAKGKPAWIFVDEVFLN